ncbi:hypothetical protein DBR06_SOUSAS8110038, partial [Sousa chinensis]
QVFCVIMLVFLCLWAPCIVITYW